MHAIDLALKELKKYMEWKTKEKRHTLELLRTAFNNRQIDMICQIMQRPAHFFTARS